MFADRDVLCVSCCATFVFSAGEQQFFEEKRFTNVPKHCKQCKAKKEAAKGGGELKRTSPARSAGAILKANLFCAERVSQADPKLPKLRLRD